MTVNEPERWLDLREDLRKEREENARLRLEMGLLESEPDRRDSLQLVLSYIDGTIRWDAERISEIRRVIQDELAKQPQRAVEPPPITDAEVQRNAELQRRTWIALGIDPDGLVRSCARITDRAGEPEQPTDAEIEAWEKSVRSDGFNGYYYLTKQEVEQAVALMRRARTEQSGPTEGEVIARVKRALEPLENILRKVRTALRTPDGKDIIEHALEVVRRTESNRQPELDGCQSAEQPAIPEDVAALKSDLSSAWAEVERLKKEVQRTEQSRYFWLSTSQRQTGEIRKLLAVAKRRKDYAKKLKAEKHEAIMALKSQPTAPSDAGEAERRSARRESHRKTMARIELMRDMCKSIAKQRDEWKAKAEAVLAAVRELQVELAGVGTSKRDDGVGYLWLFDRLDRIAKAGAPAAEEEPDDDAPGMRGTVAVPRRRVPAAEEEPEDLAPIEGFWKRVERLTEERDEARAECERLTLSCAVLQTAMNRERDEAREARDDAERLRQSLAERSVSELALKVVHAEIARDAAIARAEKAEKTISTIINALPKEQP